MAVNAFRENDSFDFQPQLPTEPTAPAGKNDPAQMFQQIMQQMTQGQGGPPDAFDFTTEGSAGAGPGAPVAHVKAFQAVDPTDPLGGDEVGLIINWMGGGGAPGEDVMCQNNLRTGDDFIIIDFKPTESLSDGLLLPY